MKITKTTTTECGPCGSRNDVLAIEDGPFAWAECSACAERWLAPLREAIEIVIEEEAA